MTPLRRIVARLIAAAMIAALAACAGLKVGPAGEPTPSSVNPITGTRGGQR